MLPNSRKPHRQENTTCPGLYLDKSDHGSIGAPEEVCSGPSEEVRSPIRDSCKSGKRNILWVRVSSTYSSGLRTSVSVPVVGPLGHGRDLKTLPRDDRPSSHCRPRDAKEGSKNSLAWSPSISPSDPIRSLGEVREPRDWSVSLLYVADKVSVNDTVRAVTRGPHRRRNWTLSLEPPPPCPSGVKRLFLAFRVFHTLNRFQRVNPLPFQS